MRAFRRAAMAALVAAGSLVSVSVVAVATATPGGAALSCTDNWQGPATGTTDWNASAANWSSGFPTGTSVVCISEPGTYTVALTGSVSVGALQVGGATSGTQTLSASGVSTSVTLSLGAASVVAAGGILNLAPATNGFVWLGGGPVTVASGGTLSSTGSGNPVYLRAPVSVSSGGTTTFGAATTQQDSNTATSNNGTFTVSPGAAYNINTGSDSFTNAGTLTVSGAMTESGGTFTQTSGSIGGNPVTITGGAIVDTAGTGAIDVRGSAGLSGTIPAGQTVTVDGVATSVTLSLSGTSVVDNGNLVLTAAINGFAMVNGSPVTVASGGTLSASGSGNPVYLRSPVTNQTGGTVTLGAATTQQDTNTATSNNGTFTVSPGAAYNINTGSDSFTNAGTLTVSGAMTESGGTFTQTSGSIGGNPVTITGGAIVDTAGTGAIDVRGSAGLSGTIPAGQTVTVDGVATSVALTLSGTSVVDNGNLVLTAAINGFAMVSGSPLDVASGGTLSSTGSGNPVYLRTPVSVSSGGTTTFGAANTQQDTNTPTSNSGTVTVSPGAAYNITTGADSFTNAGTLTVSGAMTESGGTFTQTSGSIGGNPVTITGGSIVDTAGTGALDVRGSAGLSGTIPAGQTVTVDGSGHQRGAVALRHGHRCRERRPGAHGERIRAAQRIDPERGQRRHLVDHGFGQSRLPAGSCIASPRVGT